MADADHAMSRAACGMHGMEPRVGKLKARAVTATSCRSHFRIVTMTHISSAFPMNTAPFAVNALRVLRVHPCLARPVSVADEPAQV